MNTVLQLEKMPDKSIDLEENRKRDIKDYDKLIPVITLIWLADDDLNFKDDFVSYMMTGEVVNDFIKNKNLWREDNMLELIAEREKCLEIINNKTRKLDFLGKNKLIYAFQPNIVRNKKYSKYLKWFELAEKTRNRLNEKGWFDEYLKDEIFVEIIKRINTESFEQVDWEYITDYEKFREKVKRFEQVFIDEGIEIGVERGIEIERSRNTIDTALKGIKAGLSNELLKLITNLSDDQINDLR
jgi:broad-specificity NMP kinase